MKRTVDVYICDKCNLPTFNPRAGNKCDTQDCQGTVKYSSEYKI